MWRRALSKWMRRSGRFWAGVLAQRRSARAEVAFAYVAALSPGTLAGLAGVAARSRG